MTSDNKWNIRIEDHALFIDDTKTSKVILQQNGHKGLRPYIHPLRGPDGSSCLTEDSPFHHPWQHGISTGFHGVNDCDFWFDKGQVVGADIGTIDTSLPRILGVDPPNWAVDAMWRDTVGAPMLFEQQAWMLIPEDDVLLLDLDWQMMAIPDIKMQKASYGGLFLRMPFRTGNESAVINSESQRDDDTEQQRAKWVDCFMSIERSKTGSGITICDHPGNPGHPAYWRVDSQRGINPSPCIPGPIELAPGASIRCKYRLILHTGTLSPEKINRYFEAFAKEPSATHV